MKVELKVNVIVEVTLCTMHLGKLSVVQVYESESRIESESDCGGNSLYYAFGQVEYAGQEGAFSIVIQHPFSPWKAWL